MNPIVKYTTDENDVLSFTLSNTNVSIANSIRRIILSEIDLVVFKPFPYENGNCTFYQNSTRLNNEILKQRLACIPIHIKDVNTFPINNYILEVKKENTTDNIEVLTTEDFQIKDTVTNKYLSKQTVNEIFPPNNYTGHYIDFVRLKPKSTNEQLGDIISFTCKFSIGNTKEDGMYNAVSCCSYKYTVDTKLRDDALSKIQQQWKDEGKNKDEIELESQNWKLLDGMRYVKQNSFDFIIESIGIFTNKEIVEKACLILIEKFTFFQTLINEDKLLIEPSIDTMSNSYVITLENEDYTIGKTLEYVLYNKYYETGLLTFCGFQKIHPHHTHSIIKLAYKNATDISLIKGNVNEGIEDIFNIYKQILSQVQKFP